MKPKVNFTQSQSLQLLKNVENSESDSFWIMYEALMEYDYLHQDDGYFFYVFIAWFPARSKLACHPVTAKNFDSAFAMFQLNLKNHNYPGDYKWGLHFMTQ